MAIMAPVLVVMTRVMASGRLAKGWIAYPGRHSSSVAFPVFQAYRADRPASAAWIAPRPCSDLDQGVREATVSASDQA